MRAKLARLHLQLQELGRKSVENAVAARILRFLKIGENPV
jgi:hypothetical protein